jgi:hypothetical protein
MVDYTPENGAWTLHIRSKAKDRLFTKEEICYNKGYLSSAEG